MAKLAMRELSHISVHDDDDNDDDDDEEGQQHVVFVGRDRSHITVDDDGSSGSDETLQESFEIDLEGYTVPSGHDATPRLPWIIEDSYIHCYDGECIEIQAGDTFELALAPHLPHYTHPDFFRVRRLIRNVATDEVLLQGWHLMRNFRFSGTLPQKVNECCMALSVVGRNTSQPILDMGIETIPVERVAKKRILHITNRPFPEMSFRRSTVYSSNASNAEFVRHTIEKHSDLVARWISIKFYATARDKAKGRPSESVLRRFTEAEALRMRSSGQHDDCVIEDKRLLRRWLGRLPSGTRLTFGDAFCGGGGVSQGAILAELEVLWGCDNDPNTCDTYRLNLPNTVVLWPSDVQDLITFLDCLMVDILHLSPPCQPFSSANASVRYRHHATKGGMNDERNQAALFCIPALLKKVRPRVVTVEETSGLLTHHSGYLSALVAAFTCEGYSVRWQIINFADLGLCQERKRLILIASCPGGILPAFPEKTHGTENQPYATIHDAIGSIPDDAPNHSHVYNIDRAAYDPNTQLRGLISTGGTTSYHPCGLCKFTVREQACMQGFPMDYLFPLTLTKTEMLHIIGNAVPPTVAKAILKKVKEALIEENVMLAG